MVSLTHIKYALASRFFAISVKETTSLPEICTTRGKRQRAEKLAELIMKKTESARGMYSIGFPANRFRKVVALEK
jgi:hypothetical protein